MAAAAHGAASDMGTLRMDPPDQRSKLSGLDAQEMLETRVLHVGGRVQPIKYASIFVRHDNIRVASNAKSFELPPEEVADIQYRIMAASLATGAQKLAVKVQGKEFQSEMKHSLLALTGSIVLVFTTESEQVDALETIGRSFVEGLANQGI